MSDTPPDLARTVDLLLRFGATMLGAGDTAFRVRQWMRALADRLGLDALAADVSLGSLTVTARRGSQHVTLAAEIAPQRINASRVGALERLARETKPGTALGEVEARLVTIVAAPPRWSLGVTAAAVGTASGAFSYLNGGGPPEILATIVGGGVGQWVRSLLFRRNLNQYAVTALCAMIASGLYCLTAAALAGIGLALPRHAAGFISSALFLVPGFPLVAGMLDLLQHQTTAGVTRLAYGATLLLSAAFGLSLVAAAAGLSPAPPPTPPAGETVTLLLRAVASIAGGCGFAILYNSAPRTVLAVGALALVGNELRLALHDAGAPLPVATLLGAFAVGLLATPARRRIHEPRIALTVPGIIIMVPGVYAFATIVLFDRGDMLGALEAATLGAFVVGAMAVGLAAARFVSERGWLVES